MSRLMRRFWVWAFRRQGWPDPEAAVDYPEQWAEWLEHRPTILEERHR